MITSSPSMAVIPVCHKKNTKYCPSQNKRWKKLDASLDLFELSARLEGASSEVSQCIKSLENHLVWRASSDAAKTAAASSQTLAPLLGSKSAHNRIETRKNEQQTYNMRKRPALQKVDTYIHKKMQKVQSSCPISKQPRTCSSSKSSAKKTLLLSAAPPAPKNGKY